MRIKLRGLPSRQELSELIVFISYTTADWTVAKRVADALEALGLGVNIVPPNPTGPRSDSMIIERMLSEAVQGADCFCIVTSNDTLESAWVAFEFKEAAGILGRIVFLLCPGVVLARHPAEPFVVKVAGLSVVVRHTIIELAGFDEDLIRELAIELLHDPHEGWHYVSA